MSNLMTLLKEKEPTVWFRLQEQELQPQFYAFRWLTLMLSQEFPLPGRPTMNLEFSGKNIVGKGEVNRNRQ